MARIKIAETKEHIHQLIDQLNDPDLLDLYLKLLLKHVQSATFEPTADELKAIEEGLASIKKHGTVSHEDAVARLRSKYPNLIL